MFLNNICQLSGVPQQLKLAQQASKDVPFFFCREAAKTVYVVGVLEMEKDLVRLNGFVQPSPLRGVN